ncbi:uncharacterized protein VTP21DRAFT_2416 [Calcarisporiella thermophila]|uniref:uncharacterized protein n=1 Tax=Calcarisporiella thermophila TaxID=911321 RepID=UPI0037420FDB
MFDDVITQLPNTAMSTWGALSARYASAKILAPMVRVGTLPLRLLALEYGADLVYSPETIDKRIIGSERIVNENTGTIDYVKNGALNFRTHPCEKDKLIFQMGTADPDLALQAALTVAQDVSGIDVNCGCPKKFSIQGGMGAALLSDPERLEKILVNLVNNCGLPVTCKIRLLKTKAETIELIKMIERTGVKAIAVHCRTRDQRPKDKANWEMLREIIQEQPISVPVIANGDVFNYSDIEKVCSSTGAHSAMIARGAQDNPSVFRAEGLIPLEEVVRAYVKKSVDIDNPYQNTKYTLMQMCAPLSKTSYYSDLLKAKSMLAICESFGIESYFHEAINRRQSDSKPPEEKSQNEENEVDGVNGRKRKYREENGKQEEMERKAARSA